MKTSPKKLTLVSTLLVLVCAFSAPVLNAAGRKSADKVAKRAEHKAKVLEKFDANHDGKLDRAEKADGKNAKAAMKAEKANKPARSAKRAAKRT